MAIANTNSGFKIAFATTVNSDSITVSGSDMIGIVSVANQAAGAINTTGVTFNSVSMTKIDEQAPSGLSQTCTLWGLLSPTTGVVTATRSTNTDRLTVCIGVYSGVSQSTAISSLTKTKGSGNTTSFTGTLTAGTNSWTILGCYISAPSGPGTAGSGTTLRIEDGEINYLFDSNGAVSGSTSLNVNCGGTYRYGYIMISIDPAGASASQIKTWDAVTQANVKNFLGATNAQTKTWDGVSNV